MINDNDDNNERIENNYKQKQISSAPSFKIQLLSGWIAGITSAFVVTPLDVIKIKLQAERYMKTALYHGFISSIKKISKEDGFKGFYRGLSATLLGYPPTWSIYFSLYEYSKFKLSESFTSSNHNVWQHIISALIAGSVATSATNPIWVIRTRFMIQSNISDYKYNGLVDAIKTIHQQEGIRGFYKGLVPSLLGLLHVGIQFPLYEYFKATSFRKSPSDDHTFNMTNIIFSSALSKVMASLVTYPHEVVRTRLQNQISSSGPYQGLFQTIILIFKEETIFGFYKGMTANLLRVVPSTALTFLSYEFVSNYLLNSHNTRAAD